MTSCSCGPCKCVSNKACCSSRLIAKNASGEIRSNLVYSCSRAWRSWSFFGPVKPLLRGTYTTNKKTQFHILPLHLPSYHNYAAIYTVAVTRSSTTWLVSVRDISSLISKLWSGSPQILTPLFSSLVCFWSMLVVVVTVGATCPLPFRIFAWTTGDKTRDPGWLGESESVCRVVKSNIFWSSSWRAVGRSASGTRQDLMNCCRLGSFTSSSSGGSWP